jgi:hypothetical protein
MCDYGALAAELGLEQQVIHLHAKAKEISILSNVAGDSFFLPLLFPHVLHHPV